MIVNCQLSTNNFPRFAEYIGSILIVCLINEKQIFRFLKKNKH